MREVEFLKVNYCITTEEDFGFVIKNHTTYIQHLIQSYMRRQ